MADDQERRIAVLEEQVRRLQAEVATLRRAVTWASVPEPSPPAAPAAHPAPHAPPVPDAPPGDPVPPPPPTRPVTGTRLEARIGTRWLAVAGIMVSVVAAVLFLRLAIRNGWIGPAAQILIIATLGLLIWGLGIYLHQAGRLGTFPQVLAAGGVTITAFAAYATYGLQTYREALGTSQEVAAMLLAAVAAAALADAWARRVELQAGLVTILVPLTAGFVIEWTSFSLAYAVAMSAALLLAAASRRWTGVPVLSSLGGYSIVLVHTGHDVEPWAVLVAALALLAAFNGVAWRAKSDDEGVAVAQAVAWVGTWGVGLWALRQWDVDNWWWTALLGAAAMALSFAPATRWQRLAWRIVGLTGLIGFVAFLPWPALIAPAWIVQLAAAGAYRTRRPHTASDLVTGVLTALVALRLLMREAELIDAGPDPVALLAWVAAVAVMGGLWAMASRGAMAWTHLGLGVAGAALLAQLLLEGPAVSLCWALIALSLVGAGFVAKRLDLRVAGLTTFALTLVRILYADLAGVDAAWRVLAFAGIGLALLGTSWLYVRWERQQA